jgi:hypothetical protein
MWLRELRLLQTFRVGKQSNRQHHHQRTLLDHTVYPSVTPILHRIHSQEQRRRVHCSCRSQTRRRQSDRRDTGCTSQWRRHHRCRSPAGMVYQQRLMIQADTQSPAPSHTQLVEERYCQQGRSTPRRMAVQSTRSEQWTGNTDQQRTALSLAHTTTGCIEVTCSNKQQSVGATHIATYTAGTVCLRDPRRVQQERRHCSAEGVVAQR